MFHTTAPKPIAQGPFCFLPPDKGEPLKLSAQAARKMLYDTQNYQKGSYDFAQFIPSRRVEPTNRLQGFLGTLALNPEHKWQEDTFEQLNKEIMHSFNLYQQRERHELQNKYGILHHIPRGPNEPELRFEHQPD